MQRLAYGCNGCQTCWHTVVNGIFSGTTCDLTTLSPPSYSLFCAYTVDRALTSSN